MERKKKPVIPRPTRPPAWVGKALSTSPLIAGPVERDGTFGVIRSTFTAQALNLRVELSKKDNSRGGAEDAEKELSLGALRVSA
jgi:hypothetical protein